ncbi:preprotein translocase subunit SecE [Rubripirellula sp.]|nr:preprotein translocase subunit SecE [Rubripirellula sp.]MDB4624445.1 preprotein translocase subunit SecE [Rubripirellula sp.]
MSRDIAATENGSLIGTMIGELAKTKVYKPTQGRIVRQLTASAIWVIVGLGCWSLHGTLRGSGLAETSEWLPAGITTAVLFFGAWFGFRAVNLPSFADFLIAVEAEMKKVTWPGRDELVRAAIVVIFTIFFLAISLFLFDILWQKVFVTLGVTT